MLRRRHRLGSRVQAGQFSATSVTPAMPRAVGAHLHFEMRQPAPTRLAVRRRRRYDSLRAALRCHPPPPARHRPRRGRRLGSRRRGRRRRPPGRAGRAGRRRPDLHRASTAAPATPWATLGGVARSAPAVASPAAGAPDRVHPRRRRRPVEPHARRRRLGLVDEPLGGVLTGDPDAACAGRRSRSPSSSGAPTAPSGAPAVGGSHVAALDVPGSARPPSHRPCRLPALTATTCSPAAPTTASGACRWSTGTRRRLGVARRHAHVADPEAAAEAGVDPRRRARHRRPDVAPAPRRRLAMDAGDRRAGHRRRRPRRRGVPAASTSSYVAKDDHALLHTWCGAGSWSATGYGPGTAPR